MAASIGTATVKVRFEIDQDSLNAVKAQLLALNELASGLTLRGVMAHVDADSEALARIVAAGQKRIERRT